MSRNIGSLILDIEGAHLSDEEREILAHPWIGGVILFTRNYENRAQLSALCTAIRSAARHSPLLIMTDQEGGRVQRFKNDFTRLPNMRALGRLYDKDPNCALHLAEDYGWLMAHELLAVGIDLSLAPVVDLDHHNQSVIGDRAFHPNPQVIVHLARAVHTGMQEAGMCSTLKHFPGHGYVTNDSHLSLPVDDRLFDEIFAQDMIPFIQLINVPVFSIMTSHILFPKVDTLPVTYSKIWLQDILRKKLNFAGAIISDDLNMDGAKLTHYEDRVIAAKNAGCDFMLFCNNRPGIVEILDRVPYHSFLVEESKWRPLIGRHLGKKSFDLARFETVQQKLAIYI